MASNKIWTLKYVAGNPSLYTKIITDIASPMSKGQAINIGKKIAANGWRVWVECKDTGERIFESAVEKEYSAL